jgi:hypothetical protein
MDPLTRRNAMLAWTLTAEMPKVPLPDAVQRSRHGGILASMDDDRFSRPNWIASAGRLFQGAVLVAAVLISAVGGNGWWLVYGLIAFAVILVWRILRQTI